MFFKATRVDGTDFHSGTVRYEAGVTVRAPRMPRPADGWRVCEPGVLHASSEPGEVLVGGSWPCRLFAVRGRPVCDDGGHKHGFRSLRVIEEIDAHLALGPNGAEVAASIDRARSMLASDAARDAAGVAARDAARAAARDAAREAAWYAAGDVARYAARDASWEAAGALVVRDLLTAEHFDVLTAPWSAALRASEEGS